MTSIDKILNEDSVKQSIDELCEDVKDFDQLDFVHLLWAKKEGVIKGRYYGSLDSLLAALSKAQFCLLVKEQLDNEEDLVE